MTYQLSDQEYEATKWKLETMLRRLAEQRARPGPNPLIDRAAARSKLDMIGQYLREMRLYESMHGLPLTECDASMESIPPNREGECGTPDAS